MEGNPRDGRIPFLDFDHDSEESEQESKNPETPLASDGCVAQDAISPLHRRGRERSSSEKQHTAV
jgi:hypothetical protein